VKLGLAASCDPPKQSQLEKLAMSYLELTQIEKYYDSFHALKNIDLQVEKEEFVVFVGPSGCGKSTLLRTICGLESVSSGKIMLDGQDITFIHPRSETWRWSSKITPCFRT
jgi:multiple sugar transport system ATP-binding protein